MGRCEEVDLTEGWKKERDVDVGCRKRERLWYNYGWIEFGTGGLQWVRSLGIVRKSRGGLLPHTVHFIKITSPHPIGIDYDNTTNPRRLRPPIRH